MNNFKFIVNPTSSRGKGNKVGKWLLEECKNRNLDFDLQFTTYRGEAIEIANKSCEKFEKIIAVGGDGTLQEVINGVVNKKSKIGIIPVGTGNDFVRAAGIPFNHEEALSIVINGNTKFIDIGQVNDLYFHNGVGIGFDAWVVEESLKIQYLRGKLIYLIAIFKTLISYKAPEIELCYNNIVYKDKIFLITVGNGISMGGGIMLTPFAKIDDGILDLNIIKDVNKFKILRNLAKSYSGDHVNLPEVKYENCDHVDIKSENGMAAHADGELLGCNLNELKIKIIPKAINFVISK